jgi:hypothetical protein
VPDREDGAPEAEPPRGREEVVTPLVREGDAVEKEEAIVAVRDPDAGSVAPRLVPLAEALRDFERVAEAALAAERVRPADRAYLWAYFRALHDAARSR